MEDAAGLFAAAATTIAAIMVAANLGPRITGFGFIVFAIGSLGWIAVGALTGQPSLLWQNVALLVINIAGIWRWLGVRARYDKGAAAAAEGAQ